MLKDMEFLKKRAFWVCLAVILTLQAGIIYISVRQSLRTAANQPQDAIASDIARDLGQGRNPADLTQGYVDMSRSMAPFIIIYDQYGKVVAGNGYLDNKIPQVPIGVLSAAKDHAINKVTWEPKDGVRIASVSLQGGNYYVLGGRSLDDTERQIKSFGQWLAGIWVIALALLIFMGYHSVRRKTGRWHTSADSTEKSDSR